MTVRVRPVIALFGKVYLRRWARAAFAATVVYVAGAGAISSVITNPAISGRDVIRGMIGYTLATIAFIVLITLADGHSSSYRAAALPGSPPAGKIAIRAMRGRVPGVDARQVRDLMATWVALNQASSWGWADDGRPNELQAYTRKAARRVWAQIEALLADEIAAFEASYNLPDDASIHAQAQAFRASVDRVVNAALRDRP